MRLYQLYYKQNLVCETTSEYELHQYLLTHYHQKVWKPNKQKVDNQRITTLPDYNPAKLIDLLYSNKLVDYQLNFRTTHTEKNQIQCSRHPLESLPSTASPKQINSALPCYSNS